MAIRNIVLEGDGILRKKCREVTVFDRRLHDLLDDMRDTMYHAQGVGLAAPQVGIIKQIVVIDADGKYYELINPKIVSVSGEQVGNEGCLSCPGETWIVKRPMNLVCQALDRHGRTFRIEATELLARAICHEIDHLKGVLFKDVAESQVVED